MVNVSIVMPVRNGAPTLPAQLDAIATALRDRDDVEVIIADNGSTDATVEVAERYRDRLPIRVVDASREAGINVARNEGVGHASGYFILICDADDEVDPVWLDEMVTAFEDGHELLAGPIDYVRLNSVEERRWRGADRASVYVALGFLPAGHGANFGFTRKLFDGVGGFDESFRYGGEDTDFFWRAQLAGYELHEVPTAVVHYRLRSGIRALWRQFVAYSAAEARLFKKFQELGARRRPVSAVCGDLWWLASRLPFAARRARRGAWVRRAATASGRIVGSARARTLWW